LGAQKILRPGRRLPLALRGGKRDRATRPEDMAKLAKSTDGSPPVRLGDEDYRALGAFRQAMREFLAFSASGARAYGLTSQQHQALLAVRSHLGPQAISIGELAASLLVKNHSAVGLVGRLVERGLLARAQSSQDLRRVLLQLTPAGAEALEAISVRNLGQLDRTSEILAEVLATARRIRADHKEAKG